MKRFRLAAVPQPNERGQEVVSGRGHAIVAARLGCSVCASPIAAIDGDFQSAAERFKTARDQVSGTFMP